MEGEKPEDPEEKSSSKSKNKKLDPHITMGPGFEPRPSLLRKLLNMIHQFFLQILVCWRCSWTYNYPSVDLNLGGRIIIWGLLQNFCSSEHVEFYVEFYCSSAVVVYSDQYDWLRLAKFSLKEIEMILSSY